MLKSVSKYFSSPPVSFLSYCILEPGVAGDKTIEIRGASLDTIHDKTKWNDGSRADAGKTIFAP